MSIKNPQTVLEGNVDGIFIFTGELEVELETNLKHSELVRIASTPDYKEYANEGKQFKKEFDIAVKLWSKYAQAKQKDVAVFVGAFGRLEDASEIIEFQNKRFNVIIEAKYASYVIAFCDLIFSLHDACYKSFTSLDQELAELRKLVAEAKKLVRDAKIYAALKTIGDAVDLMSNAAGPVSKALVKIGKFGYDIVIYDAFGPKKGELDRLTKHAAGLAKKGTKRANLVKGVEAAKTLSDNLKQVGQAEKVVSNLVRKFKAVKKSRDAVAKKYEAQSKSLDKTIGLMQRAQAKVDSAKANAAESSKRYKELKKAIREASKNN